MYNTIMNIFTPISRIESATGLWKEVRNSSKWYSFEVLKERPPLFSQFIEYSSLVLLEFNCETSNITSIRTSKQLGSQIDCELYAKLLLFNYQRED